MLLVDDHPIYLDGLRLTLEREIEDIEIAIAGSVASAMEKIEAGLDPDLILADFKLPDGDGLSLLKATRENHPTIAVGLLCANVSAALVDKCRALGLVACLSKERASDNIAAAVRLLLAGGAILEDLAEPGGAPELSRRRRDILAYAGEGESDKVICHRLGVTESAIRKHWAQIFLHLGVSNRTEAVVKALKLDLI